MALLGDGHSVAEIGERLEVSYRTAASTVALIRDGLGVASKAALISLAVEARTPLEADPHAAICFLAKR